jgi:hypothetical protein
MAVLVVVIPFEKAQIQAVRYLFDNITLNVAVA